MNCNTFGHCLKEQTFRNRPATWPESPPPTSRSEITCRDKCSRKKPHKFSATERGSGGPAPPLSAILSSLGAGTPPASACQAEHFWRFARAATHLSQEPGCAKRSLVPAFWGRGSQRPVRTLETE